MDKKYIIIGSIVVLVWIGFMGYRHMRQKSSAQEHRKKSSNRVTEIAKKSPRAGLALVGKALKKYYKENNEYPATLTELYPKYLNNKSLIEEIEWYYEPRGNDFYLSTAVVVKNKRMVASLDKDLRPQIERGVMVATPTAVPEQRKISRPTMLAARRETPDQSGLTRAGGSYLAALRQKNMKVSSLSPVEQDEERIISTVQTEILSAAAPEVVSGVESELSRRYLVWKNENGVLGFGNIQYPAVERQSIYAVGMWFDVKTTSSERETAVADAGEAGKRERTPELIASNLSRNHMVWKDEHSILGFGNVAYPEKDHVSAFLDNGWIEMEKSPGAVETGMDLGYVPAARGRSSEMIASRFKDQYLVWKDKEGALGFSNATYPEKDRVSIFREDSWIPAERVPVATETRHGQEDRLVKKKLPETISSEIGNRFLVWKDQRGALGFSNVEYPETNDISSTYVAGDWQRIVN